MTFPYFFFQGLALAAPPHSGAKNVARRVGLLNKLSSELSSHHPIRRLDRAPADPFLCYFAILPRGGFRTPEIREFLRPLPSFGAFPGGFGDYRGLRPSSPSMPDEVESTLSERPLSPFFPLFPRLRGPPRAAHARPSVHLPRKKANDGIPRPLPFRGRALRGGRRVLSSFCLFPDACFFGPLRESELFDQKTPPSVAFLLVRSVSPRATGLL